eukprot:TRINITY_DN787_c0_g2_i1.p1 TRINITY_DN787_c0_g2~~TRINITY_DN787_c0_g2_i1.p1  ORF type:complete len:489 (-),score=128.57 TRINITY_DN787_c0_g2_i1:39-1346(-)
MEHFIYTIDFSKLPNYPQLEALASIMHLSILKRVSFHGLEVLDSVRLQEFASKDQFPHLKEIIISNCPRLLCRDILKLMSTRPDLSVVLGACPHIGKTEWQQLAKHNTRWSLLAFYGDTGQRSSIILPISREQATASLISCISRYIYNLDIIEFLIEQGADLNRPEMSDSPYYGCSALQIAVKHGAVALAWLLMEKGSLVNFANADNGETALHYATKRCHKRMIRVLVNHGASVLLKDKKGVTPIRNILRYSSGTGGMFALIALITCLFEKQVESLKAPLRSSAGMVSSSSSSSPPSPKLVKTTEKKPKPVADLDLMNDDYLKGHHQPLKSSLRANSNNNNKNNNDSGEKKEKKENNNPKVHFGKMKSQNLSFSSSSSPPSALSASSSPRRAQSISYETTEDLVLVNDVSVSISAKRSPTSPSQSSSSPLSSSSS